MGSTDKKGCVLLLCLLVHADPVVSAVAHEQTMTDDARKVQGSAELLPPVVACDVALYRLVLYVSMGLMQQVAAVQLSTAYHNAYLQ